MLSTLNKKTRIDYVPIDNNQQKKKKTRKIVLWSVDLHENTHLYISHDKCVNEMSDYAQNKKGSKFFRS